MLTGWLMRGCVGTPGRELNLRPGAACGVSVQLLVVILGVCPVAG